MRRACTGSCRRFFGSALCVPLLQRPPACPPPWPQADLVVVCKHQRGKLASLFVGSVTKYLQAHCKRPLLVL